MCSAVVLACSGALVHVSTAAREHGTAAREHISTSAQRAPVSPTGLISGSAIDASSGQPIAGASVTLRPVGRIDAEIGTDGTVTVSPPPAVVTDSQGQFVFRALRAGTYSVTATNRSGFVQSSAFVELSDGQQVTDVTVQLKRLGSIAGSVRDEAGDPVVGMKVDVYLQKTTAFKPMLLPRGGSVTDDRGRFRIGSLPPGSYLLCACGRDALAIDKGLLPLLGATPPSAATVAQRLDMSIPTFAPTFYPGSGRPSEAVDVVLASGDDRAGMDITVHAITPRRVSGQLAGLGSNPATRFTLLLMPENDRPEAQPISAIEAINVTASGAFDFVAVPPGRYSLEVYPNDDKQNLWASVPVAVGEQDVARLVVTLWAGAEVTGRIEFSGSSERPDAAALEKARVALAPAEFTPRTLISAGSSGSVGHSAAVGADGQFRFEGVPPGRYLVMPGRLGPAWQLTESFRTAAGTSPDPIVTIDENGLSGLVITMSDAVPAMVLGSAVLAKYDAPQTVSAILFPADPATWSEASRSPGRFAMTALSNERTFRLTVVPPGEYFVGLINNDTNMGPAQFEMLSRTATRISLRAGDNKKIELRR